MRVWTAPHLWAALALWILFWPVALMLPISWLFDIVNALSVSMAIGVVTAYLPGVIDSIRRRGLSSGHYLVLGIVITWMATAVRNSWNWTWRWLGEPPWMINHIFVAFQVWVLFTAGILHMVAQDSIDGRIPRENWLKLGKWVFVGVFSAALVIVWFEPSPHLW